MNCFYESYIQNEVKINLEYLELCIYCFMFDKFL